MNSKQIRCVLELAKTLNYSRAAENLYISQSTLSYQVSTLEEEIGFPIFTRTRTGTAMTPAGTQYCKVLRKVTNALDVAAAQGRAISAQDKGVLNVCLSMRSNLYCLPEVIQSFAEEVPDTLLKVGFVFHFADAAESLLQNEFDVLFTAEYVAEQYPQLQFEPLYDTHFYCLLRPDDPLAGQDLIRAEDLEGLSFIVGEGTTPALKIIQDRVMESVNVYPLYTEGLHVAWTDVKAGLGVVICPGIANPRNNEFRWVPFDCQETETYGWAYRRDETRDSIRKFIDITKRYYEDTEGLAL